MIFVYFFEKDSRRRIEQWEYKNKMYELADQPKRVVKQNIYLMRRAAFFLQILYARIYVVASGR